MTRLRALLLAASVIAGVRCSPPMRSPAVDAGTSAPGTPATAETDAPPAGVTDAGASRTSAPSASGELPLITDEECRARGGTIVTEQTYAHLNRRPRAPGEPVHRFRVCRFPSPENGKACRGKGDCGGGWCLCTGDLARPNAASDPALAPRDGTAATGVCSDAPMMSGTWWCLVEDGRAVLKGIIID